MGFEMVRRSHTLVHARTVSADAALWSEDGGWHYKGWHDHDGGSCDHHMKQPLADTIIEVENCYGRGSLRWVTVDHVDGPYLKGYGQ